MLNKSNQIRLLSRFDARNANNNSAHLYMEMVERDWPAQILLKSDFLHEFLLFYVRLLCIINFCFGPVEVQQFKNNCSGLKIDWGSPPECSYLRNAYYAITFCCFTQVFVDSAYNQLTIALSQARNLLRRNNLSGDLTNECVNNFMSFYE